MRCLVLALLYSCGSEATDYNEDYIPTDTRLYPSDSDEIPDPTLVPPEYCAQAVPDNLGFYSEAPDRPEPQTTCVKNCGVRPFTITSYRVVSSGLVGDTSGSCFEVVKVNHANTSLYPNDEYCFVLSFCGSSWLSQGMFEVYTTAPEYETIEVELYGKVFAGM